MHVLEPVDGLVEDSAAHPAATRRGLSEPSLGDGPFGFVRLMMNWGDERYVRIYTRDTADWLSLSFLAQGLFCLILRKLDRAGVMQLGRHGRRAVAITVGHPGDWPRLEPALEELIEDGCVVIKGDLLVVPNFIEAQEAPMSDAQRQRESRERRLAHAMAEKLGLVTPVTGRDISSQNVTGGHETGQNVTSGHTASQAVTPSVPSQPSPPSKQQQGGNGKGLPSKAEVLASEYPVTQELLDALATRGWILKAPASDKRKAFEAALKGGIEASLAYLLDDLEDRAQRQQEIPGSLGFYLGDVTSRAKRAEVVKPVEDDDSWIATLTDEALKEWQNLVTNLMPMLYPDAKAKTIADFKARVAAQQTPKVQP
jgi:hypothetical protein